MKTRAWRSGSLLCGLAIMLLLGCAPKESSAPKDTAAGPGGAKIRVLFVYGGGHHSPITPYRRMFDSMSDVEWTSALLPQSAGMFKPGLEEKYDVLVMVQMMGSRWKQAAFTEEQRKAFADLLKKGIGIVALHQAIATEPAWVESPRIVGGVWRNEPYEVDGKPYPKSGCLHDTDLRISAWVADHPIVNGVPEFVINDELYLDIYKADDNVPVLVTDHPKAKGRKEIAWTRTYGASRVFYFQLGHIPEKIWAHPQCRRIVHQGIRWAAGKTGVK
ncbi:MAG: ThuA domain-containing protein [Planctomycetota bacterium]|jgi:type 1 glutamine amidotransferase